MRRAAHIRPARHADMAAIYDVCLRTADNGGDATALYPDPSLPGDVWAGAYVTLEPALAFVLDDGGVCGYVLGALDTAAFEARLEAEWWPALRLRHADPVHVPRLERTVEQRAQRLIHRPVRTPSTVTDRFPSHLHIDLLPRAQGTGAGRLLLESVQAAMYDAGSPAVHLGVSAANTNAIAFYRHLGWQVVEDIGEVFGGDGLVMACTLP